jgi:hypothetical protein
MIIVAQVTNHDKVISLELYEVDNSLSVCAVKANASGLLMINVPVFALAQLLAASQEASVMR